MGWGEVQGARGGGGEVQGGWKRQVSVCRKGVGMQGRGRQQVRGWGAGGAEAADSTNAASTVFAVHSRMLSAVPLTQVLEALLRCCCCEALLDEHLVHLALAEVGQELPGPLVAPGQHKCSSNTALMHVCCMGDDFLLL